MPGCACFMSSDSNVGVLQACMLLCHMCGLQNPLLMKTKERQVRTNKDLLKNTDEIQRSRSRKHEIQQTLKISEDELKQLDERVHVVQSAPRTGLRASQTGCYLTLGNGKRLL